MTLSAEELVDRAKTVSTLPTIYLRLKSLVESASASNRDVANLINEDPGLAARLLRVANSAFYGAPSKVDTVTRAVTLIGTRQLSDLVLATSIIDMFEGIPDDVVNMESFWQHSIACGVTARILASYLREMNIERFFVAGLLHDIGRLIIFMEMPDIARRAIDEVVEHEALLYQVEKHLLGFDHADVGRALLAKWNLPESLMNAVAFHHNPAAYHGATNDVNVIHVAEVIANAVQMGTAGEMFVPVMDRNAWQALSLPVSILTPTIAQLKHQYHDATEMIFSAPSPGGQAVVQTG